MERHVGQRIEMTSASAATRMLRRLTVATVMLALSLGTAATGASAQDEAPAGSAIPAVEPSAASSDSDLAALFPSSISGVPVDVVTWAGPDWIARYDPGVPADAAAIEATEILVASAGATLDDLTIATSLVEPSPGNFTTIAAVRIPGARAFDILDRVIDVMAGGITEPQVYWDSIESRWVALIVDPAVPDTEAQPAPHPLTLYPSGDTIWVIQAEQRPLIESIVAALPSQPSLVGPVAELTDRVVVPELGIAVSFPDDWTTEIRSQRYDEMADLVGPNADAWVVLDATGPEKSRARLPDVCGLALFRQTTIGPAGLIELDRTGSMRAAPIEVIDEGLVRKRVFPGELTGPGAGFFARYALGRGDAIAALWCWGMEPPGDLWLSIAQSIEPLPAEE